MNKYFGIALALAAMFVVADAQASVQNVKISGSVDSTYIYRRAFDFDNSSGDTEDQSVFITQTTAQIDADLTDQVSATIALINERGWDNDGNSTTDGTDVDIYLAYVTLREMLYSPLTLVVGRQDFRYGNSFVMDTTGANNAAPTDSGIASVATDLTKQTSMDAIRAILDYNPLTVELVYAVLEQPNKTIADTDLDVTLTGYNANYELGDEMNTIVEQYFWWKNDQSDKGAGSGEKSDTIKVVGGRFSTNPLEGLNVQGEYAYQNGSKRVSAANNKMRSAHGVQFITNYQVPVMEEYKPMAQYSYTKVTGDTDLGSQNDNEFTGWDPFFEAQAGGTIYNTLFDQTNMHTHVWSLQANPMEDLTAKLSLAALWLERDLHQTSISLKSPDGTTNTLNAKDEKDETYLGKEVDFDLVYDYTEDVQFGASLGYYFPGTVFSDSNDTTAKQLLVNLNVAF